MDTLDHPTATFPPRARIGGVVPAVVVDNADPEGLGRVRVEIG